MRDLSGFIGGKNLGLKGSNAERDFVSFQPFATVKQDALQVFPDWRVSSFYGRNLQQKSAISGATFSTIRCIK